MAPFSWSTLPHSARVRLCRELPPLVPTSSRKPAAIAVREVEDGLIPYYMPADLPMLDTPAEEEIAEETAPEETETEEVEEPPE